MNYLAVLVGLVIAAILIFYFSQQKFTGKAKVSKVDKKQQADVSAVRDLVAHINKWGATARPA